MARIIRFPLKMSNGTEVRTLEELQENFDLQAVLEYFTDGRLQSWLANRYYDEAAEKVAALSADMPDLNEKLCEILGVSYQQEEEVDLEFIQRRNEKKRILSEITEDNNVLNNIDTVALNQDDLFDALDTGTTIVYLFGERFSVPTKRNINYIGLNNPLVVLEGKKMLSDYNALGITFENVRFEKQIAREILRNEKKKILAGITDRSVLDNIDAVALTQEDLLEILKANPQTVYLHGESFEIPLQGKRKYIGLNKPLVKLESERLIDDYESVGISFFDVRFERLAINVTQGERLFLSGKYNEAFPIVKLEAENGNVRSMLIMMLYYSRGYNTVKISYNEVERWTKMSLGFDDPLINYIRYSPLQEQDDLKSITIITKQVMDMIKNGDLLASLICNYEDIEELLIMSGAREYLVKLEEEVTKRFGNDVDLRGLHEYDLTDSMRCDLNNFANLVLNHVETLKECFNKGADNGNSDAEYALAYFNYVGEDVFPFEFDCFRNVIQHQLDCLKHDFPTAIRLMKSSANQGNSRAQIKLGLCDLRGDGIEENDQEAEFWLRKAAEQGEPYARGILEDLESYN